MMMSFCEGFLEVVKNGVVIPVNVFLPYDSGGLLDFFRLLNHPLFS